MTYIGVSPSNGVRRVHTYTATGSQTTFTGASSEGITLSYTDANFMDVYQNGVLLAPADYTATSGTSVVLAEGAAASDIVTITVYDAFSVADTVSKSAGGTFDGNVAMAGTLGVTGVLTGTSLDISGNIDVDGTTNLDVVDIDGAVDMASTLGVTGVVTANAGVVVDNITIDGTEIDLSSGDLTIDVAGELILDADGAVIELKDGGTSYGRFSKNSNNFEIKSMISDGDINFLGNDGGSEITALTIDMSAGGNVGIGTSSPSLSTASGSANGLEIKGTVPALNLKESSGNDEFLLYGGATSATIYTVNNLRFLMSGSEKMRLDTSGNLLVGTTNNNPTSSSVNVAGQSFSATGGVRSTVDGNPAATFNRKTGNGQIVLFRKDGTTIGSINVISEDNLAIASTSADHAGLMLGGHSIIPMEANAQADGTINFGSASRRFQNLFLSGGIRLGGTGTANELDDYEEGTWTPTVNGLSGTASGYSTQLGYYIKVGQLVFAQFRFTLTNKGNMSGNYTLIQGLPFNHSGSDGGSGMVNRFTNLNSAVSSLGIELGGGTPTAAWLTKVSSTSGTSDTYVTSGNIANNTFMQGTLIYRTG